MPATLISSTLMPSILRHNLFAFLDQLDIPTQTFEHPPLFTVEESQALRGEIPGAHTKNLFLHCKKKKPWLVVALEDTPVHLKSLCKRLGAGNLSFAKPEALYDTLKLIPGSVTPFGLLNDTEKKTTLVLDKNLIEQDVLNFHPLENTATTTISKENLLKFIRATGHNIVIENLGIEE